MMKIFFCFLNLLFTFSAYSSEHLGKDQMNDIKFKQYSEFSKKWALITIRYRKDTGEMRLTYANELAQQTMQKGSIDYPDGSVFAKTGIHTGHDPQFPSSVVPQGIRRYQFMVKDKKKYASTNGWGYALFDSQGKTFAEDPKITQDACYACHTIVENRGDVFSTPFSFTENAKFIHPNQKIPITKLKFESIEIKKLPVSMTQFLPTSSKKVRAISNIKLRKNIFQGTLDEMKPLLEIEARRADLPAIFYSLDYKRFVLVMTDKNQDCMNENGYKVISTDLQNQPVIEKYCAHD